MPDDDPLIELADERRGPDRRPVPRRYLVVGAAGLLAVGFVAGLLVQRARTPEHHPAPAASASHLLMPEPGFGLSVPDAHGCRTVEHGYHEAGVTTACTGTLRAIHNTADDWRLTLRSDDDTVYQIAAHDDTEVLPVGSMRDLTVGGRIEVSGHTSDGPMRAVAIRRRTPVAGNPTD